MEDAKAPEFGSRLLESAHEAVRIHHGDLEPARTVRYTAADAAVEPPPMYGAARIREIRIHMDLSQPLFAAALNVSPETVRAWEQGKRAPDGATRRLLEFAEEHSELFTGRLRRRHRRSGVGS
jgi:putative transcriptional regulator